MLETRSRAAATQGASEVVRCMTTFGKDGKGEKGAGGVQSASKKMLLSEEEREIVCWATNFKTFLSSPSFKVFRRFSESSPGVSRHAVGHAWSWRRTGVNSCRQNLLLQCLPELALPLRSSSQIEGCRNSLPRSPSRSQESTSDELLTRSCWSMAANVAYPERPKRR